MINMKEGWQNFEIVELDNQTMQVEYLGFSPFPIFTLNQVFIKDICENQFLKLFRWELEAKHRS